MFRLTKISVANRSLIVLATVALLLIGAYVIPLLKQEHLPPLIYPAITVITPYPGASPTQVEQDVTNPLEQSFQGVQGIQQITSQSSQDFSVIAVYYDFGTDLDKAQQTLAEQVNKVRSNLPAGVTSELQPYNLADSPIIYLAATSPQNQQDLALALKQVVVPALQGIQGVGKVDLTGVHDQIVSVTLDLARLHDKGLSIFQVLQALQANNMTTPTGEVTSNDKTYAVQVGNTLGSIQDLNNVVVGEQQPANTQSAAAAPLSVKLSDVAVVEEDLAPSTVLTRTNGKPSLGISITKTASGNSVTISQALNVMLPGLQTKLGHNSRIAIISDQAPSIQKSISDLASEGLMGAAFAMLVILLFLFSIRSTLVTAISIPLSVVIALIALWTQGDSLNVLTLSALAVAIGRVVDDSIVVLENIYRHLQGGEDKLTAVLAGTREVATAVTGSTLTTVAVFLPLAFIGGVTGEYTHPLALTVTIALLASLLVALTVIPVLAYWFLKEPKHVSEQEQAHKKPNILERGYIPLISWVIRHRVVTLLLAVLLLASSFALFPLLSVNAYGTQTTTSFSFTQQLPLNASLEKTNQAAHQVEGVLAGIPGIQTYQVTIGTNDSGFAVAGGTNIASYTVTTGVGIDTPTVQQQVQTRLGHLVDVGAISFTAQGSNTVDVTVQATDEQSLRQATQQVYTALAHTPNTSNETSDLTDAVPLINIHVDSRKALIYGLTPDWIGEQLKMIYSSTTVTQMTLNGVQQNVDMKISASANTVQQMQNMLIQGATDNVRLGDIATVTLVNGPTEISHINSVRTATITLTVSGQNIGAVSTDVQNRVSKLTLVNGATATPGAVSQGQNQTLTNLYVALLVAIPLVFIIMVAIFRSLIQTFILLVSIPFALLGSIVLAFITRTAIGISSLFGFLMLIGIAVTNAIVLIDLVNQYRAKGLDARSAVIEGGRRRVRPILMTALATMMALVPLLLGSGGGDNRVISGGLAVVVIGGLASSTFLTLLLVPTLYVIAEDAKDRFRRKRKPAAPAVAEEAGVEFRAKDPVAS
nr:efflux RND transporter permease subunit [Ktedonobacteraceae bacterium]